MQVIGVSTSRQTFNPGELISLTITVKWGLADTGGIITVYRRSANTSVWTVVTTVTVGSPGLGIPNLLNAGKSESVQVSMIAPDDTGYYQIGAKEQSESEISMSGGTEIQVVPETPSSTSNTGVVHVKTNVTDTGDTLLYIDDTPVASLPAEGYYAIVSAGSHSFQAKGSNYTSQKVTVYVLSGSNQTVTLALTASSGVDWVTIGAIIGGAVVGCGVLYVITKEES